jgi:spore germination cell wall hydrolase CwlJ-like protein
MKFLSTLLFSLSLLILPLTSQEQTFAMERVVSQDLNKQLLCMAKNIYYEAASESFEGKLAVAQVTMNRVNSPFYPKTICEVVYQKTGRTYQFSWVGENVGPVRSKYAWEECLIVAKKALTQTKLHDKIYETNSMFYHATYVNPEWKLRYVAKIGNHLFYTKAQSANKNRN